MVVISHTQSPQTHLNFIQKGHLSLRPLFDTPELLGELESNV